VRCRCLRDPLRECCSDALLHTVGDQGCGVSGDVEAVEEIPPPGTLLRWSGPGMVTPVGGMPLTPRMIHISGRARQVIGPQRTPTHVAGSFGPRHVSASDAWPVEGSSTR